MQVECPYTSSNIGAMYNVERKCSCHQAAWVTTPIQPVWENVGLMDRFITKCLPGETCCVWDRELRPIRPGTTAPTETRTKELENV